MNDELTEDRVVDAFLLYNEKEPLISQIAEALKAAGREIHFWRTDIALGEAWMPREMERLASARAVLVFLGPLGWGPTQETIAIEAMRLGKRIIPVVIGPTPPPTELDRADGLFRNYLYLEITPETWRDNFPRILTAIPLAPKSYPFVATMVDGDDEDRRRALDELVSSGRPAPAGLIVELTERLELDLAPYPSDVETAAKLGSARSWVLTSLVALADDQQLVERYATRHLDPIREPVPFVRFWLLAALADRFPTMAIGLANAATRDPNRNVRLLGELVGTVNSQAIQNRLQAELESPDPEPALLYFRVRPVPALLDLVAQRLGRPSFENLVLDALTQNVPPSAAAEAIKRHFDPVDAAILILRGAHGADRARRRRYANLLAALPPADSNQAISGLEDMNPELRPLLRDMRRLMEQPIVGRDHGFQIAGYQADTIEGSSDYLDIKREVEAVTAIMLARELSPPLAIGLFGEWGAGKSFFMRAMKMATGRLRETFPEKFCEEVVEIDFNAWHYADGNLWASLVSHILERLAVHVSPPTTPGHEEDILALELESARIEVAGLEKEKAQAEAAVKTQETALQTLQFERETAEIKLTQLRTAELKVIFDDAILQSSVHNALNDLGAPTAITDVHALQAAVRHANGVGGRMIALALSLTRKENRVLTVVLLAAVVFLPIAIGWLASLAQAYLAPVVAFVAAFVTLIGGGAPLVMKGLNTVSANLKRLERAKSEIDKALAIRRETPSQQEIVLQKDLARLKGQEEGLATRLRAAEERVVGLEERITALRDRRSLQWFLADRSGSEDYRKHLGVMATIRKDFEALVERLQETPAQGHRRVDRIVLYIDDLDRCPAPKVVEVLEAVHLLLAFPLFVVVVGVDPRWLAHALSTQHRALARTATVEGRRATPQDFLEKIFQIPLALRPMSDAGFSGLMSSLLAPSTPEETQEATTDTDDIRLGTPMLSGARAGDASALPPDDGPSAGPPNPEREQPIVESLSIAALRISPDEARFASRLIGIFTTPRAVKRFSNTYRLLKAQIADEDRYRLEGTESTLGEYPTPMILLALAISQKPEAKALLTIMEKIALGTETARLSWRTDIGKVAPASLRDMLLSGLDAQPDRAADIVAFWLPKVARYTFDGFR